MTIGPAGSIARCAAVLALVAVTGSSRAAIAQDAGDRFSERSMSTAMTIAKRVLDRTRRSLVLGPSVGVSPTFELDGGDHALRTSFGVSLLRYDVPVVPTAERIADILESRARERFLAQIQGRQLTDAQKQSLADQIWQDAVDELTLKVRPRRFEKPSFAVRVEAAHLGVEDGAWQLGFTVSIGVGPVYLTAGESGQFNNGAGLDTDLELSVPMTLSRGLRSPSLEIFVRATLANTGRDDRADRLGFGIRAMLDII